MKFFERLVLVLLLAVPAVFAAPRPNIVMIISDDHHWADYGFMGHPHVKTPHLDKLAAESLVFPRGYVPSSLCCPSLATMITGLFPHQHKVTSNDPGVPDGMAKKDFNGSKAFADGREKMSQFLEAVPTLPRTLQSAGYLSLQTGKWWQGHYSRGGFTHGMTKGSRHGDEGLDIGRKTMKPITDFIDEAAAKKKPFFVWYAPMMPHTPHTPPDRLLAKYKSVASSIYEARYWAMIEWFDETCGELLAGIEKLGISKDTLVVYVADNGWIQESDSGKYAPKSKQSQYDGGLRTPIMIRWLGAIDPRKSSDLASSIDLAPTLLAAVGLKATPEMQGVNLMDPNATGGRRSIFGECFTHNAVNLDVPASSLRWRWMIQENWKLILPNSPNEPEARPELYRLDLDPNETKELSAGEGDRVSAMTSQMNRWWDAR